MSRPIVMPAADFDIAHASLTGGRGSNQDRCLALTNGAAVLLGLGDGLGGHPRGDAAAQLLMDVCSFRFDRVNTPMEDPSAFMLSCVGQAHRAIVDFGRQQTPPIAPRTTAVLAVVQQETVYWSHVGDSRLYLIRDAEVIGQTRDHRLLSVHRSGDQRKRLRASLTRCLGGAAEPPVTTCGPPTVLKWGDTLLLCSDGLWSQVAPAAIVETFADSRVSLNAQLQALVSQAVQTPRSDNVTALALRWKKTA